ncbi:histone-lysine N-methyltransferase PRDM7-like [Amblyomma americanum]
MSVSGQAGSSAGIHERACHSQVAAGDPLRANKSLPKDLYIRRYVFKRTEFGVFTLKPLPRRVFFGPYEGRRVEVNGEGNAYTWQVRKNGKEFLVDGRPLESSNWMRYVNSAASPRESNLVAYTRQGNIYYRTCKAVGTGEELLVSCSPSCARERGLLTKPRASRPPWDGRPVDASWLHMPVSCVRAGRVGTNERAPSGFEITDHVPRRDMLAAYRPLGIMPPILEALLCVRPQGCARTRDRTMVSLCVFIEQVDFRLLFAK